MKLLSLGLVVLAFVLVFALGGNKFNSFVKPIGIEGRELLIYYEDEPLLFDVAEVTRVDVYDDSKTGKLTVRFVINANMYEIPVGTFAYEFGVRNALIKAFGNLVHDSTA